MTAYIKTAITVALLLWGTAAWAGDTVTFEIDRNDGPDPSIPIVKIEKNIAGLLTAINKAATAGSPNVDFTGIEISKDAAMSIDMMWENVRMRTFDDDIIQKCVKLGHEPNVRGYEVQNIGVEMIPVNPEEYKESRNQEITVTLDRTGAISDFVISMGMHQYATMMKGAKRLDDIDRRMQILHFVEQFRTAYCEKNKEFLEDIFSDDALIITGRVRKRVKSDLKGGASVTEYIKQNKREYLTRLFANFDRPGSYINVKFDDTEVETVTGHPYIYGVTVRQEWNSDIYSDVGTVFLLWDFSLNDQPKIYVRTWQPLEDDHRFRVTEFDF